MEVYAPSREERLADHRLESGMNGFSKAELSVAFDFVRQEDWRAPIDAIIPKRMREQVAAAVIFFTATEPVFRCQPGNKLRVVANGYRAGPAGP